MSQNQSPIMYVVNNPRVWIGLVLGVLLTWVAFRGTDFRQISDAMDQADFRAIPIAVILAYVILWVRSLRWRILLLGVGQTSISDAVHASFIGYTVNYALPIRAGEVVRAYLVGTMSGYSRSAAFATVVVERIIDALSILVILAALAPFIEFPDTDNQLDGVLWTGTVILSVVGIIAFVIVLAIHRHVSKITAFLERRFGKSLPSVAWRLAAFAEGLKFGRGTDDVMALTVYTILIWCLTVAQILVLTVGFHLSLPWTVGWLILVALAVGVSVPSAPGMVGTFHYAAMIVLLLYGIPRPTAISYALVLHAVSVFPIMIVGLTLVWKDGLSFKKLLLVSRT